MEEARLRAKSHFISILPLWNYISPLMLKFQNCFIFHFLCIAFTSLELKVFLSLLFFVISAFLLFHSNLPFLAAMNEPVVKEGKGGRNGHGKGRITQQLGQILLAWSVLPKIGSEVAWAMQGWSGLGSTSKTGCDDYYLFPEYKSTCQRGSDSCSRGINRVWSIWGE